MRGQSQWVETVVVHDMQVLQVINRADVGRANL